MDVNTIKSMPKLYQLQTTNSSDSINSQNLSQKNWFAFELNDVLYDHQTAAKAAHYKVMDKMYKDYSKTIPFFTVLTFHYDRITAEDATIIKKPRQLYKQILSRVRIHSDEATQQSLDQVYKQEFEATIAAKDNAVELLEDLRKKGKKVMIVSENQSEDMHIVDILGLKPFMDVLAARKPLDHILQELSIEAQEMVFVSANEENVKLASGVVGVSAVVLGGRSKLEFGSTRHMGWATASSLGALKRQLDRDV